MASDSASGETLWYNVYKVYFAQISGPSHEEIALVPTHLPDQTNGRFYHVKGLVGLGMDYECRPSYKYGKSRTFKSQSFQLKMPGSFLPNFEHIASTQPPPYDVRALTERNPDPPVRDCAAWVTEDLEITRNLLRA